MADFSLADEGKSRCGLVVIQVFSVLPLRLSFAFATKLANYKSKIFATDASSVETIPRQFPETSAAPQKFNLTKQLFSVLAQYCLRSSSDQNNTDTEFLMEIPWFFAIS